MKKKGLVRCLAGAAAAAMLTGALSASIISRPTEGTLSVEAGYPEAVAVNMSAEEFLNSAGYQEWWSKNRESTEASRPFAESIEPCCAALMQALLPAEEGNSLCSPLSGYIALSMLAELCGGSSRQQLLELLGAPDLAALRQSNAALWKGNSANTPALKSLLANSLWLSDSYAFRPEPLERLAEHYHVSSYAGQVGTEAMDRALRQWTDEHTGGLLSQYTENMSLSGNTVMSLISTLYFEAMWRGGFIASENSEEVFHGLSGDCCVSMMHKTAEMMLFRGESFTAVRLGLLDSGAVSFFLPAEGLQPEDILAAPELFDALYGDPADERLTEALVVLTLPKFRISTKLDLLETLRSLGVTDILDELTADFSPLTDRRGLYLGRAEQAVCVEIDEQGVLGAAYTELDIREKAIISSERCDFVLDRPFFFAVTGADGAILFAGCVREGK